MKSLSLTEVAQIAISLQGMVGAHLQDALQTNSETGLGFYQDRQTIWLWLDLHPQRPMLIRLEGRAPKRKKIMRPLTLFLRSNFFGRRLEAVRADVDQGRVIVLTFSRSRDEQVENPGPCEVEIRLFPRGQNIIARFGSKSISEIKPKELAKSGQTSFGQSYFDSKRMPRGEAVLSTDQDPSNFVKPSDSPMTRSWVEISQEWLSEQREASAGAQTARHAVAANVQDASVLNRDYRKALEKKKKALSRMQEDIESKKRDAEVFRKLGDWLKTHRTLELTPDAPPEISTEWESRINAERSLSWNIENCFTKAKDGARKMSGTAERIELVAREVVALEQRGPESFAKKRDLDEKKGSENLLSKSDARGRRLALGEGLEVYIGKSAADNLALLRRAQPFDYWLHLRDQPGSHAIMRRGRSRMITDLEFQEAGRWVIEQSLGARAAASKGERFDLLIVECRFVKPIKGDRLGRVNYSNDRVLSVSY